MTTNEAATTVRTIYDRRFAGLSEYRRQVWEILCRGVFDSLIPANARCLDVGCGWGEFIRAARAGSKYAMDLNPRAPEFLPADVKFLQQDCSAAWPLADGSLDVVVSSNFFEHLPSKDHLLRTLREANRCLAPGGRLICVGPNIARAPGPYWDFFDHCIPLSDASMAEALEISGLTVVRRLAGFVPFSMSTTPPLLFLKLYLKMPWAWRFFGRQFLIVAEKRG